MNADDLLIASSLKFECIPLLISSTAETLELNTNFPSKLVFKGKNINIFPGYAFYQCSPTSVSFPELTTISGNRIMYYAFSNCTNLTSVSFPELTTVAGEYAMYDAFSSCTNLTSVSFPKLTTVAGENAMSYAFSSCTNLTSVSFPELTTISGDGSIAFIFANCTNLTSVSFPELTTISGKSVLNYAFSSCKKLTSVSFPKLTTVTEPKSAFFQMGTTSALTVHLPKALSSLGITNHVNTNDPSYGSFVYDL